MSYTVTKTLTCDTCGKTESLDALQRGWVNVQTIVGGPEQYAALVQEASDGGQPLDSGEFCRLRCLGQWAFAQDNLRELDKPVTEIPDSGGEPAAS